MPLWLSTCMKIMVIDQFLRFVCSRSMNPEGKAQEMSVSIQHTKRAIGQYNYPVSLDTINMSWASRTMNVCPCPQELYNSKHIGTERDCITYMVTCIP